tara:strand:+ start:1289 stop:1612 length:324 start_codon:yes stop_codon:yes gene_type:complete
MKAGWQDDEGVLQAIDDTLLAIAPHVDDLLEKLFDYKSLPTTEPDVILFGVIGPYVMSFRDHRDLGEGVKDAHHRGMSAILSDPAVTTILQSMAGRGMDALARRSSK